MAAPTIAATHHATGTNASAQLTSVVTGAAGFVGQALVQRLLIEGDRVRALVLRGDPLAGELRTICAERDRLEIIEGDVTEYASIAAAFAGAQRAFHTAALVHAWAPRARFWAANVTGTQNVARAAREHGVARLVAVSTSDVFGLPVGDRILDETCARREWAEPYADSKIAAERWLWDYARESGLATSIIYPGWVYGPGDRAFFPGLVHAIRSGTMMFWHRNVRLPWVFISNLVDACLLASSRPHAIGEGYLIFDTLEGPTLQAVCARLAAVVGARAPTRHIPYSLALGAAWLLQSLWRATGATTPPPLLTVDVKAFGFQWEFSNAKAREHLGWTPNVPTEAGMQQALDFVIRQQGNR